MMLIIYILLFIVYGYIMYVGSKRDYVSYYMKNGSMCYNCKCELDNKEEDNKLTLCNRCKRDYKLNKFYNRLNISDFKRYLLSSDKRFLIIIVSLLFSAVIIKIVLKLVFDITWFDYVYPFILLLCAFLNLYYVKIHTIKKGHK